MEKEIFILLERFGLELEKTGTVVSLLDKKKKTNLGIFKHNDELYAFLCGYEKGFSAGQWDLFNR